MYQFNIEKNILLPPEKHDRRRNCKYPWPSMEVGDSFLIEEYSENKQMMILSLGIRWANRNDESVKFASRKEGNRLRIFRIK